MVSDQSLTSSKHVVNFTSTIPKTGGLGNFFPRIINPPPPLPASHVASSSHQYPPKLPTSSIPTTVRGARSNNHRQPIYKDDIVIAVMGITRAGKSSFINKAVGRMEIVISNDLASQTRAIQPVRCLHPDGRRNVVLVDTPGFDDTHLSEDQILKIIAHWLNETYRDNIKLSGLLYLHRISDNRVAGASRRDLAVFKDLCGKVNMKNVVLVTTMWDEVEDLSVGSEREEYLLSVFWKDMIRLGSRTRRFRGTRESAWEIINCLDLERPGQRRIPLQIQQEMVDRGLPFHETLAAKTLHCPPTHLAGEAKTFWTKLRNMVRRVTIPREPSVGLRLRPFTASSTFTSRFAARTPISLSSVENTFSGCGANGRQNILSTTTKVLRIARQDADIFDISILERTTGTALRIVQLIKEMGGTHHAIIQVMESTGWLFDVITKYAVHSELPSDMKRTLGSFQGDLNNLENVVVQISRRGRVARFLLHDAEVRAITVCTASIKAVCDTLEARLAMDDRRAIAQLEDQVTVLWENPALWQCKCRMSFVPLEKHRKIDSRPPPRVNSRGHFHTHSRGSRNARF